MISDTTLYSTSVINSSGTYGRLWKKISKQVLLQHEDNTQLYICIYKSRWKKITLFSFGRSCDTNKCNLAENQDDIVWANCWNKWIVRKIYFCIFHPGCISALSWLRSLAVRLTVVASSGAQRLFLSDVKLPLMIW